MLIENEDYLEKKSTIQISEDLRNALKNLGKKGESYEDVLWRLVTKKRRRGMVHNKKELSKNFKNLLDGTLERFDHQIQDLQHELDIDGEEINTEEIRSILKAMEYLCDDLDDLPLLEDKSK
jgi:predicted CopG family antitoxin